MSTALSFHRYRRVAGLLLLACWLGWTVPALVAVGAPPPGDAAQVEELLMRLGPQRAGLAAGQPWLLQLRDPQCRCAGNADDPALIAAAGPTAGQRVLELPGSAGTELIVLDSSGRPVYAGPLAPPPRSCGGRGTLADALPALLDGRLPPLFLPSRCRC